MSRFFNILWWVGPLGLLVGASYAFYHQYTEQMRLDAQLAAHLQQFSLVLSKENKADSSRNEYKLSLMEYTVENNQNQPVAVAAYATATAFHNRTKLLVRSLQLQRNSLLAAAGNPHSVSTFRPDAALQQQITQYARTARHLLADSVQLTTLANAPIVEALTALAQTESDILACEARIIQLLNRKLATLELQAQVIAVAAAESDRVAPGTTYKAWLGLVKSLSGSSVRMTCNGHSLPIGADGAGIVRFRAPTRPGPATWTGTIRLNQNGRDTTFRVTVPYRVVRR